VSNIITKVEHLEFFVRLPAAVSNNGTWKVEGLELNSSALRERRLNQIQEGLQKIAKNLVDATLPYSSLELTFNGVAVTSLDPAPESSL